MMGSRANGSAVPDYERVSRFGSRTLLDTSGDVTGENGAMPTDVSETLDGLLRPLLGTLERVGWVQRHLFPPMAERLGAVLEPQQAALAGALRDFEARAWPEALGFMRERLAEVARLTLALLEAFVAAAKIPDEPIGLFRALRRFASIQETLYPLAPALDPVSRWFLEPARRDDDALVARLRAAALRDDEVRVGVLHAANERDQRGGFSLYVPEGWDGRTPMPMVVALHGGHGHGRDYLWVWLREARARGMLVLAPTSRDRTWSIMGGEDVDAAPLGEMIESVAGRYAVDHARVLLTGMSDGATYALLAGLDDGAPFTHLAPACGVLHPRLLTGGRLTRAHGRPIYLVHGALDWMFPVHTARMARQALQAAGAVLVYREIEDLSHTYPRDENPAILDWLVAGASPPAAATG
jgi:phospholipase/carboxylesterase